MRPRRKTLIFRRTRATEMRGELARYRLGVLDGEQSQLRSMATLAAQLANLVSLETDGNARDQVNSIWQAYLGLSELAEEKETE